MGCALPKLTASDLLPLESCNNIRKKQQNHTNNTTNHKVASSTTTSLETTPTNRNSDTNKHEVTSAKATALPKQYQQNKNRNSNNHEPTSASQRPPSWQRGSFGFGPSRFAAAFRRRSVPVGDRTWHGAVCAKGTSRRHLPSCPQMHDTRPSTTETYIYIYISTYIYMLHTYIYDIYIL